MSKYFMGDTRLAGLERMMMDSSRKPTARNETQKNRTRKSPPCRQPVERQTSDQEIREGGV